MELYVHTIVHSHCMVLSRGIMLRSLDEAHTSLMWPFISVVAGKCRGWLHVCGSIYLWQHEHYTSVINAQ